MRGRALTQNSNLRKKQQYIAELVGAAMAAILVFLPMNFILHKICSLLIGFASTILAGVDPTIARNLFIWMIPGAIIQAIGGPARQLEYFCD